MLRPFRSGYLRSEALVVSGGEIYLPLIIINYMLVWMERKKKKLWMETDIPMLRSLSYCAVGDVYYMFHGLWTYFCEEFLCGGGIYFFFILPLSDLLLPVNSCECVAQDFLSICKSKKFFFSLFSSRLFCLYSLTSWKNENERMAGEKTFSAAGVNLKEPV